MEAELVYAAMGVMLVGLGLYAVVVRRHLIRKLLGVNIFSSGVFVVFISLAMANLPADPVPQAMVLTGIVVAVSATALGLVLVRRIVVATGDTGLEAITEKEEQHGHREVHR